MCDPKCITCKNSSTSCLSCLPGQYFNGSACRGCVKNCMSCTSSGCTQCKNGYALNNNTCRKCSQSCSSCAASDITSCTSCAKYLRLSSGKCVPCPSRCQTCVGDNCAICDKGYRPATNGSCVPNCHISCLTCSDKDATSCTSCYLNYNLNGTKCVFNNACSQTSSCTDCGQGSGYFLTAGQCYQCANISKCLQCSQTNPQACSICSDGYFINGTKCSSCPSICSTCISNSICSGCVPGFTLPS